MNDKQRTAWFEGLDAGKAGNPRCPYNEATQIGLYNAWDEGYREGWIQRPAEAASIPARSNK